jgi:hypothetical protein
MAGHPLKFESVEILQAKIDDYFANVGWQKREVYDKKRQELVEVLVYEPATITGLAIALDTSRKVLCEYQDRDGYSNAINRAKAKCEHSLEYGALAGHLNPAMAIFSAKNNYDWKDKSEQDVKQTGELIIKTVNYGGNDTVPVPATNLPTPPA